MFLKKTIFIAAVIFCTIPNLSFAQQITPFKNPIVDGIVDKTIDHIPYGKDIKNAKSEVENFVPNTINRGISLVYTPNQSDYWTRAEAGIKLQALPMLYSETVKAGGLASLVEQGIRSIDQLEEKAKTQNEKMKDSDYFNNLINQNRNPVNAIQKPNPFMSSEFIDLVLENADTVRAKLREILATFADQPKIMSNQFDANQAFNKVMDTKGLSTSVSIPTPVITAVWQQSANEHFENALSSYSSEEFLRGSELLATILWQLSSKSTAFVFHVDLAPIEEPGFAKSLVPIYGCTEDINYKWSQSQFTQAIFDGGICLGTDIVPIGKVAKGAKGAEDLSDGMKKIKEPATDAAKDKLKRDAKRAKDEIEDQIKEEAGERFEDIVFPENGNQKDTPDSDSYYKDIGQEDLNEEVDDIYKYK